MKYFTGALKDVRPQVWCLTPAYLDYMASDQTVDWRPGVDYYVRLIGRLVQAMQGKHAFPYMDWRFNEFPNEGAHALYVTCVELMGLPVADPGVVGGALLDVVLESHHLVRKKSLKDHLSFSIYFLLNL